MKSTNATHTPLPWALTNCSSHIQIHREGWPRDSWTVANLQTQAQDEANAALIVRAVNSHSGLVAALEDSLAVLRLMGCDMSSFSNSCASLARAKGAQS